MLSRRARRQCEHTLNVLMLLSYEREEGMNDVSFDFVFNFSYPRLKTIERVIENKITRLWLSDARLCATIHVSFLCHGKLNSPNSTHWSGMLLSQHCIGMFVPFGSFSS